MKLVSVARPDGQPTAGALTQAGDVVLPDAGVSARPFTMADVLGEGWVRDLLEKNFDLAQRDSQRLIDQGLLIPANAAHMRPPVDASALLVNVGTNYAEHDAELGVSSEAISWFMKSPRTVVGHGSDVCLPSHMSERVDYEGELCVVFARDTHCVGVDEALDHIGGYTLANDVSARDAWPEIASASTPREGREAWSRMLLGKQLPTFGPFGPAVVTADEIPQPDVIELTTTLNGDVVQHASVTSMKVPIPELVSYLSRYFTFRAGDVLSTGTPAGVGQSRDPQRFLRDGDEVSVSATLIGTLTNRFTTGDGHE